jgi:UDP-N-acetylglucosamine transferase subunit ALG13
MVFVTVGNATQGFERLLKAVDEVAGKGVFAGEDVLLQTGNNPNFRASHCQQKQFIEMSEFESLLGSASLIISHGGAGTLINLLKHGKVPIVMPRRREYSEHVDDHQVELVKALAAEGRVIPVYEESDLESAVMGYNFQNPSSVTPQPSAMIALVAEAIEEIRPREL